MLIVEPAVELINAPTEELLLRHIETAARTCYKSEDKICDGSAERMVKALISKNHGAMLEHGVLTVRIICDRGVSHELVRHRVASFAQESTRYCRYDKGITVIKPPYLPEPSPEFDAWCRAVMTAESVYQTMRERGVAPEIARSVLPTCVKTEVIVTANCREWRHIITLRSSRAAHPQIRAIADLLLSLFVARYPVLFGDIADSCPASDRA